MNLFLWPVGILMILVNGGFLLDIANGGDPGQPTRHYLVLMFLGVMLILVSRLRAWQPGYRFLGGSSSGRGRDYPPERR